MEKLEDGKGKSGGFSCAGLGAADEVVAIEQRWDGLALDLGRCRVLLVLEGLQERLNEPEVVE